MVKNLEVKRLVVKNPPAHIGDTRNTGLISELGRSPGGGHDNPLRYSCLENLMDRGGWWATVHGVAKSWIGLDDEHFHFYFFKHKVALHVWENFASFFREALLALV